SVNRMGERETVAVIGGGSWGTTLAHMVAANGFETLLWLRSPKLIEEINAQHTNGLYLPGFKPSENLPAIAHLQEAVTPRRTLIIAVPSHGLRAVALELGNHVDGGHVLIHGVKGIEPGSFKRMSEVLREETPCRKIGALSGPNLAKEIMRGQPSATVIA